MGDDISRRELTTDAVASAVFALAAAGLWLAGGAPGPGMTGLWLTLLCALLTRVEFRVGNGHGAPVMLATIPMLVLCPAPVVPLLIGAAQLARALTGRRAPRRPRVAAADPARRLALRARARAADHAGARAGHAHRRGAADRRRVRRDHRRRPRPLAHGLWIGTGSYPRAEVRATALGLHLRRDAACRSASRSRSARARSRSRPRRSSRWPRCWPSSPASAGLRDEQAATLQTILQHASDLILIASRDGRLSRSSAPRRRCWARPTPARSCFDRVHPDDVQTVRRSSPARRARPSSACATATATCTPSPPT